MQSIVGIMAHTVDITLLGKPGCHLCDDARDAINRVRAELCADATAPRVRVIERSILDDEVLRERHGEEIPVVFVGDRMHSYWTVDEARLAAAICDAGRSIA